MATTIIDRVEEHFAVNGLKYVDVGRKLGYRNYGTQRHWWSSIRWRARNRGFNPKLKTLLRIAWAIDAKPQDLFLEFKD